MGLRVRVQDICDEYCNHHVCNQEVAKATMLTKVFTGPCVFRWCGLKEAMVVVDTTVAL